MRHSCRVNMAEDVVANIVSDKDAAEGGTVENSADLQDALTSPVKLSTQPGAKTSEFYSIKNIPERFNHPDWFEGYSTKPQHPFYSPSSSVYGSKSPTVHTMPTQFHGRSQKFSKNLGKFGMYRNHSLNTAMDRSKV